MFLISRICSLNLILRQDIIPALVLLRKLVRVIFNQGLSNDNCYHYKFANFEVRFRINKIKTIPFSDFSAMMSLANTGAKIDVRCMKRDLEACA